MKLLFFCILLTVIQGGIEAGNQLLEFHHLVFIEISIHHLVINSNSSAVIGERTFAEFQWRD